MKHIFAILLLAFVVLFVWGYTCDGRMELFSKGPSTKHGGPNPEKGGSSKDCNPCAKNQECVMNTIIEMAQSQADCIYECKQECSEETRKNCEKQCQKSFVPSSESLKVTD